MNDNAKTLPASDLWQTYLDCTADLKTVMRIEALSAPSSDQYGLAGLLSHSDLPGPKGKPWSYNAVRLALDGLKRKGLITAREGCKPILLHPVTVDALASPEAPDLLDIVNVAYPTTYARMLGGAGRYQGDYAALVRMLRHAIYSNDGEQFAALCTFHDKHCVPHSSTRLLATLFAATPIGIDWLRSRHPLIQIGLFRAKLDAQFEMHDPTPDLDALRRYFRTVEDEDAFATLGPLLSDDHLLAGRIEEARTRLATFGDSTTVEALCATAAFQFLTGQADAARQGYRAALKRLRKDRGRRKVFLDDVHGLLFLLSLIETNDAVVHHEIGTYLDSLLSTETPRIGAYRSLQALLWLSQGFDAKAAGFVKTLRRDIPCPPLDLAMRALAEYAVDPELSRKHRDALEAEFGRLNGRFPLFAQVHAEILIEIAPDPTPYQAYLADISASITLRFTQIMRLQEPWQRALDNLGALLGARTPRPDPAAAREGPGKRLAWFVDPVSKVIDVVEQTAKGTGWSDGRPIALKRLHEHDARLTYLTPEDRAGLVGLRREAAGWGDSDVYYFDPVRVLPALVGHPAVFDARQRSRPLELVAYPLELIISKKGKNFHLALSHTADEPAVFLEAETHTRYRVIEFPRRLLSIQDILGRHGLTVPIKARDQVIALIRGTNPTLPIRAEIDEIEQEVQPGITAPVVQIIPQNDGIKLNLMVRPFGTEGPAYVAGLGGRSALTTIAGQQIRVSRDLQAEIAERNALIAACPTLRDRRGAEAHEWVLDDPEGSLECLLELQAYTGTLAIEWPEGQRIRVHAASSDRMKVKISRDRDWFNVDGTITLNEDRVLEMQFLLDRLSRAQGRFVKLEDGSFVALTHQLQSQLQKLTAVSETHRSGRRVHALGAAALDAALAEGGAVTADAAWKRQVERITAAEGWTPALPGHLQADLRDYQLDGFVWLSRLARWGAGACLADDMGLGKTVQAIAVLLERAQSGPCLVVAPTSVCPNWGAELRRFAPTLAVHRLSASNDRAALIEGLGSNDVLICSYGLLHQESASLAGVTWSMVVLDEAQAIKNADTKRAQASLSLRADFRVVLTGTPVENYLDELWSLFNFLNPGLLGSREGFQKRFAIPIERDRDPQARMALRSLIRPFLLRRTKAAVLSELPPRTEQTIVVEMNEAERIFYEALRRQALDSLAALDTQ
ncbi:SNF2-related protein, partial [Acidiphilium sp.]|uniref:SNF2-related protein n=1 Tax=Acidiphilium sp. TaxID=527 RepID=UPI003D0105EB